MKKNINSTDRIMRFVIAVILAALYFAGIVTGTTGIVLLIAAAIIALTGAVSFCPIYYALGISTNKKAS